MQIVSWEEIAFSHLGLKFACIVKLWCVASVSVLYVTIQKRFSIHPGLVLPDQT